MTPPQDPLRTAAQKALDFLQMLGGEWQHKYGEPVSMRTRGEVERGLEAALALPPRQDEPGLAEAFDALAAKVTSSAFSGTYRLGYHAAIVDSKAVVVTSEDALARLADVEARDADSILDPEYVPPTRATDSSAMRAYDRRFLLAELRAARAAARGERGLDVERLAALEEFLAASDAVEEGVVDFTLHASAVERLRAARRALG